MAKVDPGIGLDDVTNIQTPVVRVPKKREIFTSQVLSQMDTPNHLKQSAVSWGPKETYYVLAARFLSGETDWQIFR